MIFIAYPCISTTSLTLVKSLHTIISGFRSQTWDQRIFLSETQYLVSEFESPEIPFFDIKFLKIYVITFFRLFPLKIHTFLIKIMSSPIKYFLTIFISRNVFLNFKIISQIFRFSQVSEILRFQTLRLWRSQARHLGDWSGV